MTKNIEEALLLRVHETLKLSWGKETTYPLQINNWTKEKPSVGQCAVTALVIHYYLGGKIHKNTKFHHYWNELPSGVIIDLTKDQFNTNEQIVSEGIVSRSDLLEGNKAILARTEERYKLLKKRVALEL